MTTQYGFFLKSSFDKSPNKLAHLDDVTFETLEEAIDAAYASRQAKEHVLNIFSIDMQTGEIKTVHNHVDADAIFTDMSNEESDTTAEDRRVIDSYNFRNDATL